MKKLNKAELTQAFRLAKFMRDYESMLERQKFEVNQLLDKFYEEILIQKGEKKKRTQALLVFNLNPQL